MKAYRLQAKTLSATEAAYVAGLVDGEGCITAVSRRSCIEGGMSLGSTNRDVLVYLKELTGIGSVTPEGHGRQRKKNHKPVYVWEVTVYPVKSLLIQLVPFLRIKKKQAELMIELFSFSKYPTQLVSSRQLGMISEFRELNFRGVKETVQSN